MGTLDEKIDRVDQRIARQENAIERRGKTKAQVPVQDSRHRILKIRSIVRFPWSITGAQNRGSRDSDSSWITRRVTRPTR